MPYFAVEYTYDVAAATAMDEVRPRHREYLSSLADQGINIASGPWTDEAPGALLVMHADNAQQVEELLDLDPFFIAGFITTRSIRAWNPVIGQLKN
ncbi:YciI family protein [Schaalia suimastitidis]|uniref:YciI family protein n=1 Tax=Schaalia suimastitidis TaxID=121163 RepID=UPI00040AF01B|nr:YciI family protein [Schaalia suimastitidis]